MAFNNEQDRIHQGEDSLRDVVNRTLAGAGITRTSERKGFEVHPALLWPLPRNGFRCRFLGVSPELLGEFDIGPTQPEMEVRSEDLLWMSRVALSIADKTPYKVGGCWHLAMSPSRRVDGANQQRLILFAMTQAAKRDLNEVRHAMDSGKDLPVHIPTKAWAAKIAPLQGSRADERDDEWNRLILGRTTHWIFGTNIHSEIVREEITPIDIFGKVETLRPGKISTNAIRTAFSLKPVGLAFVVGFRGKVNAAAGSNLLDDRTPEEFHAWIWDLPEGARRLLTHIITAPVSNGDVCASAFDYLDDPWRIASILGTDTQVMNKNSRQDLRKRIRGAAQSILETAPPRFQDYMEASLRWMISRTTGHAPMVEIVAEASRKSPHPPLEGNMFEAEGCEDEAIQEIAPPLPGNHPTLAGKSPHPIEEIAPPHQGNRPTPPHVNAVSIFVSPLFKKEDIKIEDKFKTLTPSLTPSGDADGGTSLPLDIELNEEEKAEKQKASPSPAGMPQVVQEATDPLPCASTPQRDTQANLKAVPEAKGSMCNGGSLPGSLPDSKNNPTSLPAARVKESTPRPSLPVPVPMSAKPTIIPFTGKAVLPATKLSMDKVTTMAEYLEVRGLERREGVSYVLPGQAKPSVAPYTLPQGSRVPRGQETHRCQILDALTAHPALAARFPSDLIERLSNYQPSHEGVRMTPHQVLDALELAPGTMTTNHIENLLRAIDTAPDDLVGSKVGAMRTALEEKTFANIWFRWGANLSALAGWRSFLWCDPYSAHAAAQWRKLARRNIAGNEMVARAYADWWCAAHVTARLTPGITPDVDGLRDTLHQAILDELPAGDADRLRDAIRATTGRDDDACYGDQGRVATAEAFRGLMDLDIDAIATLSA